jgi:hypothetical protein
MKTETLNTLDKENQINAGAELAYLIFGGLILFSLVTFWLWVLGIVFQPQQAKEPPLGASAAKAVITPPMVEPNTSESIFILPFENLLLRSDHLADGRKFLSTQNQPYLTQIIVSIEGPEERAKLRLKGLNLALELRKHANSQNIQLFIDVFPAPQENKQILLQSFESRKKAQQFARRSIVKDILKD